MSLKLPGHGVLPARPANPYLGGDCVQHEADCRVCPQNYAPTGVPGGE